MLDYSDLIGIPFVNHGRSRDGLDCYGLVKEVYKKVGIDLPEYYISCHDRNAICSKVTEETQGFPWQKINEPVVPCLIAIRFNSPVVNHTAVYIGGGKFIHTREKVGVCVDRISNPAWNKVIVGFYKYVGGINDNADSRKKSV